MTPEDSLTPHCPEPSVVQITGLAAPPAARRPDEHPAATRCDDPAALAARLADLQARIAARTERETAGLDESPFGRVSGWRTVGREEAARMLAGRGLDLDTARAMISEYRRDTSARIGTPVWEWGLDQADLADIATLAGDRAAAGDTAAVDVDSDGLDGGRDGGGWEW